MRIVNVRAHRGIFFHNGQVGSISQAEELLRQYTFNSGPKNIGRELLGSGRVSSFSEWRFWGFGTNQYFLHDLPLRMIHSPDGRDLNALKKSIATEGEPEVIWAEGIHFPDTLRRLFELCPNSLKMIYPKYCEPWLIEGLGHYDVCLVDEEWQIEEMRHRHPGITCRVWDKLVDYEQHFFPTNRPKKYDICYVARLHPRKYHKLLFNALAKLRERQLTAVLVGTDENDCQKHLEPMAKEAGVKAVFTGHVSRERVNDFINESRLGVLCDRYDAAPRAMLEYMAADVPVLANAEMRAGIRYVAPKAGLARSPEQFHEGVVEILDHLDRFKPREHLIENYSTHQVVDKLWTIVSALMIDKGTFPTENRTHAS